MLHGKEDKTVSIPKIIHYCWFGENKKPAIIKKCIRSWRKYCPGYRIVEWNESNFDVNCISFCADAYKAKKWAFVSDYVRLKVLLEYGGIYMDTDVELIRPIDDLLILNCFIGFQHEHFVNNGLIVGAVPQNHFIRDNAEIYEKLSFYDSDDSRKMTVCQEYTTELLRGYGLKVPDTGEVQCVNGIYVFPSEYFCPYDHRTFTMNKTANTYAIHHFASSWWDKKRRKEYACIKLKTQIDAIIHIPNRIVMNLIGQEKYSKLKSKLKKQNTQEEPK